MNQYSVLPVLCNRFPCEGPRTIPVTYDFSSSKNYSTDLKSLMTQGQVSEIQAAFIDNSSNNASLTLVVSVQNQTVVIPAGGQAYVMLLVKEPQFNISSQSTDFAIIHFLNFPVTNQVWMPDGSQTQIINFPTNQLVSFNPGVSNAFAPSGNANNLTVGVTSTSVAIAPTAGQNIRLLNVSTNAIMVRYGVGAQTAVLTDLTLMPGQAIIVNANNANTLAAISSVAGVLNYCLGNGGI